MRGRCPGSVFGCGCAEISSGEGVSHDDWLGMENSSLIRFLRGWYVSGMSGSRILDEIWLMILHPLAQFRMRFQKFNKQMRLKTRLSVLVCNHHYYELSLCERKRPLSCPTPAHSDALCECWVGEQHRSSLPLCCCLANGGAWEPTTTSTVTATTTAFGRTITIIGSPFCAYQNRQIGMSPKCITAPSNPCLARHSAIKLEWD